MSVVELVKENQLAAAVLTAALSALLFAVGTTFQHRASGDTPRHVHRATRILAFLVTQPMWLLGLLVAGVALLLHALALRLGALAVVQPVMVSAIVLAVPLRAALSGHLPGWREFRSVLLAAIGLAVLLVAADPEPRTGDPSTGLTAVLGAVGLACAAVIARASSRARHKTQALMLGVASGVLFGLNAALLKLLVGRFAVDGLLGLLTWQIVLLVLGGVLGITFNQRAYRVARLSASMPALNIVEVVVAIVLGAVMFGEVPAHSPVALVVQGAALTCIAFGVPGSASLAETTPSLEGQPAESACPEGGRSGDGGGSQPPGGREGGSHRLGTDGGRAA